MAGTTTAFVLVGQVASLTPATERAPSEGP